MKKKANRLLIFLIFCTGSIAALAQERKITGTVKDSVGYPIAGASVSVKNFKSGAGTDATGHFKLTVPAGAKTIVISSVGYDAKEVSIGAETDLTISLSSSSNSLQDVVVVGFGKRVEAKKISYAVSSVAGADIAKTNTPNPINALQGKVPGLYMSGVAGGPQTTSRILLRGISDIQPGANNQPLFVIDGVLLQPGITNTGVVYGQDQDFGNQLKNLNADDIENISVLKGSAATALYGSAAQNGVILITSKKGAARKGLGVSLTQQYSIEKAYGGAKFQNQWGAGSNPAYFDSRNLNGNTIDNGDNNASGGLISFGHPLDGSTVVGLDGRTVKWSPQPNNYLDVYRTGFTRNTNVALDGGNETTTYRFSWTNMSSNGITPTNDFSRNNFFLRATQKLGKFIDVDAGINYGSSLVDNPQAQNSSSRSIFNAFVYSATRDYDSKYALANLADPIIGGVNKAETDNYGNAGNGYSPVWFLYKLYYWHTNQNENTLRGNLDLTFHFKPWLKLLLRGNLLDTYTTYEEKYQGSGKGFLGQAGYSDDFSDHYYIDRKTFKSYRGQALLTADKKLSKDMDGSFTLGGEIYNYGTYGENVSINGLNVPGVFNLSNYANYNRTGFGSDLGNNYRNVSFYAFGDLGYKEQLFLNFSERVEYSSSLVFPNGTGNNVYQYPSVGLAWLVSKTFNLPEYISFAKLRASYAQTGKDLLPWQISSNFRTYSYNGTNASGLPLYGFSTNQIIDPNIKPQRTNEEEVGLNLQFLKNRIGIDVAVFQKITNEQIATKTLAPESGASGLLLNIGSIRNRGLEIALSTTPLRTRNFSWISIINFTKYVNKILSYSTASPYVSLDGDLRSEVRAYVGAAYGDLYSINAFTPYQAFDANGKPIADQNNGKHTIFNSSGYWRYLPSGGGYVDGKYYNNEAKKIGNINPDFLWSWSNTFNYKSFVAGFMLDARVGGQLQSFTYKYGTGFGDLTSSVFGRDKAHGGITYTGKDANGIQGTWNDGMLLDGIFEQGMTADVNGTTVELGGMLFKDAVAKGYVQPVPAAQYYAQAYGSWSRGIADLTTFDDSWVSLREVSMGYNLPQSVTKKIKINNARLSLVGRNLLYLYNSFGGINPEGIFNNRASAGFEFGAGPSTRSIGINLYANF
jgi:iron complex outermembrane recepter protein